ncbi:MAG: glycosyltransferase [Lachnospiraceae bacterium]|nr:glycosyltransferase [Lachnospiraceae bacterium]
MGSEIRDIKVSVITICLNAEKTISDTFEAMLAQTYTGPIEYIVKDGCSSDRTLDIAESYRERFEQRGIEFKLVSEPDDGIYYAMNQAIDLTTGEIVGMINADDRYEPVCIKAVVDKYIETGFDLCFGDLKVVLSSGKSIIKKARYRKYTTSRDWNHPTQFVKRSVYDKFRFRCLNISDDMDLYFAVKKTDAKIVVINEVLADFTIGGVSTKIPVRQIPERIKRRYMVYRINGYSRFYIFECIGFELVKFLGANFG